MCRYANNGNPHEQRNRPNRVVLWAPPRSLSTTVERALIEHPEIEVMHEPFGVPHYWSSEAASSRQAGDAREAPSFDQVAKACFHADLAPGKNYFFTKCI